MLIKNLFVLERQNIQQLTENFFKKKIDLLPIVGPKNKYVGYHLIEDNLDIETCDFVVMAGGFGKRLLPLTENTPKPLIKIQNKPMIDYILSKAKKEKLKNIKILTHYKSNLVEKFVKKISVCESH